MRSGRKSARCVVIAAAAFALGLGLVLLAAPAARRAVEVNLAALGVRAWDPARAAPPAAGLTIPNCPDSAAAGLGPCARVAARAWLAGGAPGGPAQAVVLLRAAELRPLDRYYLALAEDRSGDRTAALQSWRAVGAEDAILARGRALARRRDYPAALAEFGQVLAALPDDGWAYLERGRVRSSRGDWPGARADFTQAVARAAGAVALTELGAARWYADRDLAGARTALAAGWAAQPSAWAAARWAGCLLDAGQLAEARAVLAAAAPQFALEPVFQATQGRVLAAGGNPAAARALLRGALAAHPERADLHAALSGVYRQLGDAEAARQEAAAAATAAQGAAESP